VPAFLFVPATNHIISAKPGTLCIRLSPTGLYKQQRQAIVINVAANMAWASSCPRQTSTLA
jgi:hypothetical protein